MKKHNKMIELWGDVVEIKHLLLSIFISSFFTMGAYFLAPAGDKIKGLFFGLLGAVAGFIISTLLIRPKRIISLQKNITKDKE